MANPLLTVENLCVTFPTSGTLKKVIENFSFRLNKGDTLGIVGESGSGKSVTALALMGLLNREKAKISANACLFYPNKNPVKILECSAKQLRKIRGKQLTMVFQEPMTSLNPVFTCGWQVAEVLKAHTKLGQKQRKEKILALFEQVKLPEPKRIYSAYPHQLSGGQKQRVMIAMAIICKPSLLIADEPTTALDVTVQQNILELFAEVQQAQNMGLIFISHDLNVVANVTNQIIVVKDGKMVESGKAAHVFRNPKNSYTKALLACRPPTDARPKRLLTVGDFLQKDFQFFGYKKLEQRPLFSGKDEILQVKALSKIYHHQKGLFGKTVKINAVNNVSFHVKKGETLGLVGESGCGKTTLSRLLLRLNEPDQGKISYNGQNILQYSGKDLLRLRKKMQIIFQDPFGSLNPRIKIGKAICEAILYHKLAKNKTEAIEKAKLLLEKTGLDASAFHRLPHQFSGGQRQRIVIARALAVEPEFIICDESVSALDVSVQAMVLNLLSELKDAFGLTYIFISHDLSVVNYFSDRIMVMDKGCIVETGTPDNIYHHPKNNYTKKLIAAIPEPRY